MNQPSTLVPQPVTARGRRTREQLLRAAEAVFARKGFERASIADITREAGSALGTFYVYFPDKKTIFVELVGELGVRLRQRIREAIAASGAKTRLEMEREGYRAFFVFCAEHPGCYAIVRQAEFVDMEAYHTYYRRMADGYVRGLTAAMKKREVRKQDVESLAYALMGIADFLGMRFVLWEARPDVDALVARAMEVVRPLLAAEADATRARARSKA
jgi:AcrR family transcriptional regulator